MLNAFFVLVIGEYPNE